MTEHRSTAWPLWPGDRIQHVDYGTGRVVETIRIQPPMQWVRAQFETETDPRSIVVLPPGGPGDAILKTLNGRPYSEYSLAPPIQKPPHPVPARAVDHSTHPQDSGRDLAPSSRVDPDQVVPQSARYTESLFYMTPIENLPSILTSGLLPLNALLRKGIVQRSIALQSVQELRDRIFVVDGGRRLNLHDYVPLYFVPRTPMLAVRRDRQNSIAYIEIASHVLDLPGAVLTDGNASRQGLHAGGHGTVDVYVAHGATDTCRRYYRPYWAGPSGRSMSGLYSGSHALERLPWDGIRSPTWANDELKRQKLAETLVPERVAPEHFLRIHVRTREALPLVSGAAAAAAGCSIPVCVSPPFYFADVTGWNDSGHGTIAFSTPAQDRSFEEAAWADSLALAAAMDNELDDRESEYAF